MIAKVLNTTIEENASIVRKMLSNECSFLSFRSLHHSISAIQACLCFPMQPSAAEGKRGQSHILDNYFAITINTVPVI